jgi:Spy/CpxP family protein refolding chaperone
MRKSMFVKSLIGCALLLLVSVVSFAQDTEARGRKGRGEGREAQIEKWKTELNLSDEQVAKIQAANKKRKEQMDKLKEERKGERKENMEKIKGISEEFDRDMKAILTPEQYTKFDEIRDDKREQIKEKMKEKRKEKKGRKGEGRR